MLPDTIHLKTQEVLFWDYKDKCLSGGADAGNHGGAPTGTGGGFKPVKEENLEEDLPGDEIEGLLAAAAREER